MNALVSHVERTILARRLLRPGQSVLVGVSGGLDSMVLFDVLHRLAKRFDWKLVVGHFNHRLRGRHSQADQALVKQAAAARGLRCVTSGGDVREHGRRERLSLEMAGRALRQAFFARTADRWKIPTVALAHHADDQVELFFLRLFRGAGGDGLGGMKWIGPAPFARNLNLVRPLLDLNRAALAAYARDEGVAFREDSSNASLDHLRNRIRHQLVPFLTAQFGPATTSAVARTMAIVDAEADYVEDAAQHWLAGRRHQSFEALPPAVQRRCLLLQLRQMGINAEFDLVESLRLVPDKPVTVGPEQSLCRSDDGVIRCQDGHIPRFNPAEMEVNLEGEGGTETFGEVSFKWDFAPAGRRALRPAKTRPGFEHFDGSKVGRLIHLRHWREGDRYQPIGMTREIKLQDAFINQKIPRARRHQLVVATTADGRIFWVENLRISDQFKLDKHTSCRLKWQWRRENPAAG